MIYRTMQQYGREMRALTLAHIEASKIPPAPAVPQRELSVLWPRMPCHTLCRYTNEMRRPHVSCWWFCRLRRFFYGKLSKDEYHYNPLTGMVVTKNLKNMRTHVILLTEEYFSPNCSYVMNIFTKRRFARVKDILMNKLFQIYNVWWIPHKKTILTMCEGLAN
ncbi:MAG: hypothetical protein ABSB89_05185 [Candidatus Bathyarchaeia archaeon]